MGEEIEKTRFNASKLMIAVTSFVRVLLFFRWTYKLSCVYVAIQPIFALGADWTISLLLYVSGRGEGSLWIGGWYQNIVMVWGALEWNLTNNFLHFPLCGRKHQHCESMKSIGKQRTIKKQRHCWWRSINYRKQSTSKTWRQQRQIWRTRKGRIGKGE